MGPALPLVRPRHKHEFLIKLPCKSERVFCVWIAYKDVSQSLGGYLTLDSHRPRSGKCLLDIFGGLSLGEAGKSMGEIVEPHHLLSLLDKPGFQNLGDH